MTSEERLEAIKGIIEGVDCRASAADGPVSTTDKVICLEELRAIYRLAGGSPRKDFANTTVNPRWAIVPRKRLKAIRDAAEIYICAACHTAACWLGIFMCEESVNANLIKTTVGEHRKTRPNENECYYTTEYDKAVGR